MRRNKRSNIKVRIGNEYYYTHELVPKSKGKWFLIVVLIAIPVFLLYEYMNYSGQIFEQEVMPPAMGMAILVILGIVLIAAIVLAIATRQTNAAWAEYQGWNPDKMTVKEWNKKEYSPQLRKELKGWNEGKSEENQIKLDEYEDILYKNWKEAGKPEKKAIKKKKLKENAEKSNLVIFFKD